MKLKSTLLISYNLLVKRDRLSLLVDGRQLTVLLCHDGEGIRFSAPVGTQGALADSTNLLFENETGRAFLVCSGGGEIYLHYEGRNNPSLFSSFKRRFHWFVQIAEKAHSLLLS